MALASGIPPWLNVGPTDYLQAIHSGTQAGLEVARMRATAQEAAARRALAQQEAQRSAWEFGERLRQQAQLAQMENERQREYQSGVLDWHREQMRMDAEKAAMGDREAQARIAETMRHNLATEGLSQAEAQQDVSPTEWDRDPTKSYVTRGGAFIAPEKPNKPEMTLLQRANLERGLLGLEKPGAMELPTDSAYQNRTNKVGQIRASLPPLTALGAGTNAVPQMGTLKPLDRQTAIDLLKQAGGDKEKARELARQLGYTF